MNSLLFLFHDTLKQRHLNLSLDSLFRYQTGKRKWDKVMVYNTHTNISTESIVDKIKNYSDQVGDIVIIEPGISAYSLNQDLQTCFTWIKNNINTGRVLVLKGDYAVSNNFNEVYGLATTYVGPNTQWTLPIYNAKEFIDDYEILEKLKQNYFQLTNNETYYRCGTNLEHTPADEILSLLGKTDIDPQTKFIAHNVIQDYNLHVFGWRAAHLVTKCFDAIPINSGWNCVGPMFQMLEHNGVEFYMATRAFGIHVFHAVNRNDPRKMNFGQRY